jgi:hypothetical protein
VRSGAAGGEGASIGGTVVTASSGAKAIFSSFFNASTNGRTSASNSGQSAHRRSGVTSSPEARSLCHSLSNESMHEGCDTAVS